MNNKNWLIQCAIVLIGALLFIPGLGSVHLFDWDELNFAESAREMLVTGDYLRVQVDFVTFWEKPPLFFWLQALSMKMFGVNEFAARFPNAICGIATLLVLFNIGRQFKYDRFVLVLVFAYACSLLPFFYFKSGIIDPWFNLFIFLGIHFFIRFTSPNNRTNGLAQVALSGLFIGLAILTKGPVGLLIFLLCFAVYLFFRRFKLRCNWKQVVVFTTVAALVGGLWFLLLIAQGDWAVVKEFIDYQVRLFSTPDAGHGGFFGYHFVILFFGVFPASVLALPTFRRKILKNESNSEMQHFFQWQMILFWVVLLLFTVVTTKIVHYSSMCYFPLTFLAAWYVDKVLDNHMLLPKYIKTILLVVASVLTSVVATLPFIDSFKQYLLPVVDEFTRGNLEATSSWIGFEPLVGIVLIVAVILFYRYSSRRQMPKAFLYLGVGSVLFISATMFIFPRQVEKYSQKAVIEFYQSKVGEDCYIRPLFHSYAHYFYAQTTPENSNLNEHSLRFDPIAKPAYFVMRKNTENLQHFLAETPGAQVLYEKNGFVFLVRYP